MLLSDCWRVGKQAGGVDAINRLTLGPMAWEISECIDRLIGVQ